MGAPKHALNHSQQGLQTHFWHYFHAGFRYNKLKLAAYIHSAPLGMPRDGTSITVRIDKGIRAARGGNQTGDKLEAEVAIPGRTALRFDGAQMTLVDNARYEPEQLILITSTSPVPEKAFAGKVQVFLLPVRHPKPG